MKRVRINRERSTVDLYQKGFEKGHAEGLDEGYARSTKELDAMDKQLTDLRVQNKELDSLNKALLDQIEKLKNSRRRVMSKTRSSEGMATSESSRKTTLYVRDGTPQDQWAFKRDELSDAVLTREFETRNGYRMETYQLVDDCNNLWEVTVFADTKKEVGRKRIGGESTS